MIRNFIKVAFRNFINEGVYSVINVLGLSIGIAVSVIILQFVYFERSFDDFHDENIYNLSMEWVYPGYVFDFSGSHPAMGPLFKENFEEVEAFCRFGPLIGPGDTDHSDEDKYFVNVENSDTPVRIKHIILADSNVFSMLSYDLIQGSEKTVLKDPFTAVVSKSTSIKLFGDEDPVGKLIEIHFPLSKGENSSSRLHKITGVFEDLPINSNINGNIFVSMNTFESRVNTVNRSLNGTWRYPFFPTYLKLKQGTDTEQLQVKFRKTMEPYLAEIEKENNLKENAFLIPNKDFHLYDFKRGPQETSISLTGDSRMLTLFTALAFLILFISWVNYINLNTTRSIRRAKEVGLRKVNGASKYTLIKQFFAEALLLNVLSSFVGLLLVQLCYPLFANMIGSSSQLTFLYMPSFWLLFIMAIFVSSILIGFYPAFVLTSYKPTVVMAGSFARGSKGIFLRKSLVFTQFLLGAGFIASVYIIDNQLRYMKERDRSVNTLHTIILPLENIKLEDKSQIVARLKNAFTSIPEVQSVTGGWSYPGGRHGGQTIGIKGDEDSYFVSTINKVTPDYFKEMGHQLVAGNYFPGNTEVNRNDCILNEKAVKILGFESPEAAIGQLIYYPSPRDKYELKVVGVIRDYYKYTKKNNILPEFFLPDNSLVRPRLGIDNILVKLKTDISGVNKAISQIEYVWQELYPGTGMEYTFLDQKLGQIIENDIRFGQMFTVFTFLGIFVSCMGLFGLSSYNTTSRRKEIGIRKTLGGSVKSIVWIFSKEYLRIILLASAVGLPLGLYFLNKWLQNYPNRISIGWDNFIIPLVAVFLIAFITVGYQTFRSANANPVKLLRSE